MNKTTIAEIKALLSEDNHSEPIGTKIYLREDNPTPELRAAIKDEEAFKRHLEQSKY